MKDCPSDRPELVRVEADGPRRRVPAGQRFQELADAIYVALTMSPESRERRANGLREIVTSRDPGDWIDEQIADIRAKAGAPARR